MNPNPRTTPHRQGPAPEPIDPRELGRPVHLLPRFGQELHDDITDILRTGLNRRYRASFQLGDVRIARTDPAQAGGRWLSFSGGGGRIGFSLDRNLLLIVLHYRYGAAPAAAPAATTAPATRDAEAEVDDSNDANEATLPTPDEATAPAAEAEPVAAAEAGGAAPAPPAPPAITRETATEERLGVALGLQLAKAVAARIDAGPSVLQLDPTHATPGLWTIHIAMSEAGCGVEGMLRFSLDGVWMARLLRRLAPQRVASREAQTQPLAQRLQLTLVGRLVDRDIPLGELLDLQPGDVIPVSLGRTEAVIDDSCLFHATVAERKGKLCLTSFEDAD